MIIPQEEKGSVEEFFLNKNIYRVFETISSMSQATLCDTEELKSFIKETQNLLGDFIKHIEKVEKKNKVDVVKGKFHEMTNQDFGE